MFANCAGFVSSKTCSLVLICLNAVTLSAAPHLRLSTAAVGPLYIELGDKIPTQTIYAFNIGDGSLNLSVSSSANWLSGSPGTPTSCATGPVTACIPIQIAVSVANLAVGTYTESLSIGDPCAVDAPQTVTVTVQVNGAPSSLDLYVTPAGGPLPTASVVVHTGGAVQSSVKTSDGGNWLSFALAGAGTFSFRKTYELRVSAQPGQSGDYTGSVALSGSTFAPDNQTIPVNFHVTSQPILRAWPIWINGSSPAEVFANIGLGRLAITGATVSLALPGAEPKQWLTKVRATSSTSVTLSTAKIGSGPGFMAPLKGSYYGTLTLDSNAANTTVPFPLHLNLGVPGPTLSVGGRVDPTAFRACLQQGSDRSFDELKQALGLSDSQFLRCQQEAYSEPYYKVQAILTDDQKAKLQAILSRLNDVDGGFAIWLGLNNGVGWPFCYCGCPMSQVAPYLGFTKAQTDKLWELQQATRHGVLAGFDWDRGPQLPLETVMPLLNEKQKAIAMEMEKALILAREAKELGLVSTKKPDSGPFCQ